MALDIQNPQFRRLLTASTAMAFGGMLGSLGVVGRNKDGLQFQFHWSAPVLFVFGATLAVVFWRLIFRFDQGGSSNLSRRLWVVGAALLTIAFGSFLYPLRLVSPDKRLEVIFGISLALVVLSGFGWLIFKTIRWVEESSREQEQDAADSDRDRP